MFNVSKYRSFDERKSRSLEKKGPLVWYSFVELLEKESPPTSEDTLTQLSKGNWATTFRHATREFLRESGLTVQLVDRGGDVPPIGPDVTFKYISEYRDVRNRFSGREDLLVAVVWEDQRVIGYGIARRLGKESTIEVLDVDEFSRRSVGLGFKLSIEEREFSVGVGHIVADALIEQLRGVMYVDANHHSSRYIFKSLGFVSALPEGNPCWLHLTKEPLIPS